MTKMPWMKGFNIHHNFVEDSTMEQPFSETIDSYMPTHCWCIHGGIGLDKLELFEEQQQIARKKMLLTTKIQIFNFLA